MIIFINNLTLRIFRSYTEDFYVPEKTTGKANGIPTVYFSFANGHLRCWSYCMAHLTVQENLMSNYNACIIHLNTKIFKMSGWEIPVQLTYVVYDSGHLNLRFTHPRLTFSFSWKLMNVFNGNQILESPVFPYFTEMEKNYPHYPPKCWLQLQVGLKWDSWHLP